jgi:UDP-N-acetylglucosamine transferase subunit ALG13
VIFATVGVQLPFDRLVRTLDDWATRRNREDVIAQVGASHYAAKTIECHAVMAPEVFRSMVERAELVVAHAGMGSIITAFELGKPIIVLPRLAALGEHRNDHQLATSRRMAIHPTLSVAADEHDLVRMLDEFRAPDVSAAIASHASDRLLSELAGFIRRDGEPARSSWFGRRRSRGAAPT